MTDDPSDELLRQFAADIEQFDIPGKIFYLELLMNFNFDVKKLRTECGLQLKKSLVISIIETDFCKFLLGIKKLETKDRKKEIKKQIAVWSKPSVAAVSNSSDCSAITNWEKKQLDAIINEIEDDKKIEVKALTALKMDIYELRSLLGLPPLPPHELEEDSTQRNAYDEFEILLRSQKPEDNHEEAKIMLAENRYNVELTCNQLNMKRFSSIKNKANVTKVSMLPKPVKNRVQDEEGIWPDQINHKKALYDKQMGSHPSILDLHYYNLEEANECVEEFIKHHQSLRTAEIIIITGKGNNSESNNTIKKQTIKYLKKLSIKYIFNFKNSGQLIITLF